MSNVVNAWEKERMHYQKRYAFYARKYKEQGANPETAGHLQECSYVLISIFGLSSKQVEELEQYDFCGLTQQDLDSEK